MAEPVVYPLTKPDTQEDSMAVADKSPDGGVPEKPVDSVTEHSRTVGEGYQRLRRRLRRALLSLGPFATALAVYSFVVDDLPDSWFKYVALRDAFSALVALVAGGLIRLLAEYAATRTTAHPAAVVSQIIAKELSVPGDVAEPASPIFTLAGTAAMLERDFRSGQHDGKEIFGWSQYIGDTVQPSAIGTSYGLRLAIALDVRNHQINYGRIVESLVSLERPTGGWAASTQREIGRPEATALVLGAAVRGGLDHARTVKYAGLLEEMMAADTVGLSRTTTLAVVVSALADVAPDIDKLRQFATLLVGGAHSPPDNPSTAFWGESLAPSSRSSVPHTARAIVALRKAARVLPNSRQLADIASSSLNWLNTSSADSLQNVEEQLRRPVPEGFDALVVGHFTAAWVARAFMTADDVSPYQASLRIAVREVLTRQERGIWQWQDDQPMWMAYQGASVLRDYLLRGLPWPP